MDYNYMTSNYRNCIDLTENNEFIVNQSDWTDDESALMYNNYVRKICWMIRSHSKYRIDNSYLGFRLTYLNFVFIINRKLTQIILDSFEYYMEHKIYYQMYTMNRSNWGSGSDKGVFHYATLFLHVTPELRNKIEHIITGSLTLPSEVAGISGFIQSRAPIWPY